MKLLLDEMWRPAIAEQLRKRGHDVQAVAERSELRSQADTVILATAHAEQRAVVTENVRDYRILAAQVMQGRRSHSGLIFTTNRAFPRSDRRTVGRLVLALEHLLSEDGEQENLEWWLA